MADDLDEYEAGQLDAHDRKRIRRDFGRTDALWATLGPVILIVRHWQALVGVAALVVMINSPRIIEALSLLIGGVTP